MKKLDSDRNWKIGRNGMTKCKHMELLLCYSTPLEIIVPDLLIVHSLLFLEQIIICLRQILVGGFHLYAHGVLSVH